MLRKFEFSFRNLEIQASDLEELMGFNDGTVPEPFPEIIQRALTEAPDFCTITGGYKYFDRMEVNRELGTIRIEDQVFSPGKIVVTQLREATSAALMVCTAGENIYKHAQTVSFEEDPLLGYVFDLVGSVVADKTMDKIQQELEQELHVRGLSVSDRFSPGYCDWKVIEQQALFSLLPKNFCGISLSESSLMSPVKSVSAIAGAGPGLKQRGYQCSWCSDKNCMFGKIKRKKEIKKGEINWKSHF